MLKQPLPRQERESEKWFGDLFENSQDAIFLADIESGRIIEANEAASQLLGKPHREITGLHFTQLHPPHLLDDMKAKFTELVTHARDMKQSHPIESAVLRSDGREVPVEISARLVQADGKQVLQGIFRDVTEIRMFGEALKRAESRYRTLFEEAPIGIFVSTMEGRFTDVNPALARMLGYESPEETLREVKDIAKEIYIHPERRDEIIRLLKAGARVVNFENLYRRKDGGQFVGNLNVKVMHDKSGQPCFLLGHVEDITRRKQAEEELAFRNAILSTQQEASLDGILVVDEQGRIISFNRRFVEMWEIPGKVIESRSDQQALQSVLDKLRDPKQFLQRINYLYEHRNEKSEEEIELKDGRTFDRYSAPMYGTEGKYYGRIWFFRDVTGRRRTG